MISILALPVMLFVVSKIAKFNKKQFIKITALMILGLPIGMWLFDVIPERPLKVALGIFMIYVGIKGLYDSKKNKTSTKEIEIVRPSVESVKITDGDFSLTDTDNAFFLVCTVSLEASTSCLDVSKAVFSVLRISNSD